MIKAILFDFNGVIIDDEPIQHRAYQAAFEPLGISITDEQYYAQLGKDDRAFVEAICQNAGHDLTVADRDALIERKSARHRELISDELPLFPGVVSFIKSAARHYTLGLVSMARRVEIEYVLERAGLTGEFSAIISAEDVRACKPDPDCCNQAFRIVDDLHMAAGRSPVLRAECLVIEDAPPGILGARAAGMRTLGVTNTVSEAALRAAGADVVTHDLFDWTVEAVAELYSPAAA
ncbi:MAG: HAD family phosphatase [Pyrinomonadaceae bacterium]